MSDQRSLLEPFPRQVVKQLPKGGIQVDFVSWTDKLQRLMQLGLPYDWQIVGITDSGDQAEPVACHGRLTIQMDGQARVVDGIGQGRDAKNASTDAFSRACAFLGLGLHLWCGGGQKDGGFWVTGAMDREAS